MTSFTDSDLDDMHHALGRPDGPHVRPYRNRYVVGLDSKQGRVMAASRGWELTCTMNGGRDGVFAVTHEGRAAMYRWQEAKHRAAGQRRYVVSAKGCDPFDVMARSAAAAKYALYLHLADAGWCNDGFKEFVRLSPMARAA